MADTSLFREADFECLYPEIEFKAGMICERDFDATPYQVGLIEGFNACNFAQRLWMDHKGGFNA